ncbi:acetylserotonin O-methyltransferase [Streptomyces sp. NBC_00285]|uniref:methyltransferase n=1 Tax=Streptomyces sp. NBC_00285 TaxID=2975700 RepID=UPI002E2CB60B|nr:methyltransferase [Streptomyces sp. NBC_00285]
MAIASAPECCLPPADLDRIEQASEFIRRNDTASALDALLPSLTAAEREEIGRHLRLAHTALLVFPRTMEGLREELSARGLHAGEPTPSVVVRGRLAQRYGRPAGELPVAIVRVAVTGEEAYGEADGRAEVELFALEVPEGSELALVAAAERAAGHEAHTAFEAVAPTPLVLHGLTTLLLDRAGALAEGGGHNPHENATVLYFRTATDHRIELYVPGRHPELLAAHLRRTAAPQSPGRAEPARDRLLHLMTGAWTTQAIAVAAELRLADHLDSHPGADCETLADLSGSHPDSLGRLLRYLAGLGLVRAAADGSYHLTELGEPLRTGSSASFHPLARLYGGPFYQSFGELLHAVRTGEEGFAHLYGEHHFVYFARHPELADLFDRAMAASAPMFAPVPDLVELSAHRTVVDVAGGNGELLRRLLQVAPHLNGVLLERSHAVESAEKAFAAAGLTDRCRFVTGDFTSGIPEGGDLYILSRVLHDWDDAQCLALLRRCARSMAPGTELLLIERLLPTDPRPCLATAWDIHMLCNVGGRERTGAHYRQLLQEAGFTPGTHHELPLQGALLRARRQGAATR